MKITSVVACLLCVTYANKIIADPPEPVAWDKDTLPACPKDTRRTLMDDHVTHVVKYPFVGASCKLLIKEESLVLIKTFEQGAPAPKAAAAGVIPAEFGGVPKKAAAASSTSGGATGKGNLKKGDERPPGWRKLDPSTTEHCPDFNERHTLVNGRDYAVPYPKPGWNCHDYYL